ncbi:hypothetical protein [Streptomyces sp. NBC_00078]|uniref:hypothetical protein n=1 Tax=unclassified Streptomyces TaxID=2593676 RepID=UPI00225B87BD|nr:hypothetical protein [Streptomyces sp. NBC_00078]MCX5421936.1 hypothetical protein [Streptomyces sp. NBC_00078]
MPAGHTDSPASLYGGASSGLGILACVLSLVAGYIGAGIPVIFGALAVTLAIIGFTTGAPRRSCTVGLCTGLFGFLLPVIVMTA